MNLKFIDLFAGIGGFHIAMHKLGGECVFASEIDKNARKTYEENIKKISPHLFEDDYKLFNTDILQQKISGIPNFDLLCAGFPCQPFSLLECDRIVIRSISLSYKSLLMI